MASRRVFLTGLLALPAACASPNPILYVLAPVPGAPSGSAPRNIELRAIALPRYLERSQIVRSSEGYRMDVLSNEWWGEPLDALISRILLQDLGQRLPGGAVYGDNGAITTPADATVEVNIQRFDMDQTGSVLLLGRVAIDSGKAVSRGFSFSVHPSDGSTSGLVAAMSVAVGQLADTIAAMVRVIG